MRPANSYIEDLISFAPTQWREIYFDLRTTHKNDCSRANTLRYREQKIKWKVPPTYAEQSFLLDRDNEDDVSTRFQRTTKGEIDIGTSAERRALREERTGGRIGRRNRHLFLCFLRGTPFAKCEPDHEGGFVGSTCPYWTPSTLIAYGFTKDLFTDALRELIIDRLYAWINCSVPCPEWSVIAPTPVLGIDDSAPLAVRRFIDGIAIDMLKRVLR